MNGGKISKLPDDQLAQVVAWLFQERTYSEIAALIKTRFGLTCSIMAVRHVWLQYAPRAQEVREQRVIKLARVILQDNQQRETA